MVNIQFFNTNIVFKTIESHLTERDIIDTIPYFFEGKEYFIQFYLTYNGCLFPNSAFFYRDSFYKVSEDDYNLLSIESFFSINDSSNSLISIWNATKENMRIRIFANDNFPFAVNASGNLFWIELLSGKVKYICMETSEEILVAPSFIDFCKGIQANMR